MPIPIPAPDRFHLHPAYAVSTFHDEVVACALSPGLGDDEAKSEGAREKPGLGPLAFLLAGA